MILIEAYAPGGKDPVNMEVSRLVVKTEHGNPICLVVTWGDNGQYLHADQNDDDFDMCLKTFGIESATVLRTIRVGEVNS